MLLELGAQVHGLQLLGRVNDCLSSRVKARRNVLSGESHRLEVLLRQLVIEILLQRELHKLARCYANQV